VAVPQQQHTWCPQPLELILTRPTAIEPFCSSLKPSGHRGTHCRGAVDALGLSVVWLVIPDSQDAKVDLKPLIASVLPIYSLSDTINLFCVLFFILINKLITCSAR
jgi:hypothetical protein